MARSKTIRPKNRRGDDEMTILSLINDKDFFNAGREWAENIIYCFDNTVNLSDDELINELYMSEEHARMFSPFEIYAYEIRNAEINDDVMDGAYWDEFDKGVEYTFKKFIENRKQK